MKKTMKTGKKGIELVKSFEGLKLTAYRCPSGVATIGYGHTKNVTSNMKITPAEADKLLREDLSEAETAVNRENLPINQNQFDALVSLVFNIGADAFRGSTLLKMIRINPQSINIRTEFGKWCKAKGSTLPGLALRRKAETNLYFEKC